jgi:ABC-type transporter Mla maintaining outer membrane lipid asymmetry ATPase subunit MlaF
VAPRSWCRPASPGWSLRNRRVFVYRGQLAYQGPAATLADAPDPLVRQFVSGALDGPLEA